MQYDIFESPIGKLTVSTNGNYITSLHIEGDRYFTAAPQEWVRNPKDPLLMQAKQELTEYLTGDREQFSVPVQAHGTDFQKQVWKALQSIKSGSTTTYSEIAINIGKPKAVRAVGTAIGKNPICIIVPCHRVLASDGSLGGYVAGVERKQRLLNIEKAL